MAQFSATIQRVVTGGPYAYVVLKDGVGQKAADNQANLNTAMDNVKTDIAGLLAGETVDRVTLNVVSSLP